MRRRSSASTTRSRARRSSTLARVSPHSHRLRVAPTKLGTESAPPPVISYLSLPSPLLRPPPAAEFILGSAKVYSHKVEYLYSLIYSTLDVVSSKHKRRAAAQAAADGVDAGDLLENDEVVLLDLKPVLVEKENVDIDDETEHQPYAVRTLGQ